MRRRIPPSGIIVAASAAAAVVLSFAQPSPEGLARFGVGDREVRAAPGSSAAAAAQDHNLTALEIFNRTLVRIRDSYVDPGRLAPEEMLYGALDAVQLDIPEVMIDADEEADALVVHVKSERREFPTAGVDSPWRLSGVLKKIFRFIETHIPEDTDLAAIEYAAVNGMLSTLDPHSSLLDPDMARQMDASTSGEFGGLGIVIEMRDRQLTVVEPMDDTPAQREGVEEDDHIVSIDGSVTENLTLREAVNRMRGAPGTDVVIEVEREGENELLDFEITRERIRVPSVESELLAGDVGYVNVEQFASRTADELREHLDELEDAGARAWILDLRQNPGGLLEQAVKVADLFVDEGTLVTTVGGGEREPRRATGDGSETDLPMAVLVSGVSASASEIVAGSLKNLDRAVVLGSTTFGKGSVQILYDNDDGSKLKLTIAEYLTPGDRSIQSHGIAPDIALQRMLVPGPEAADRSRLRLLAPTRRHRESELRAHLDSDYAVDPREPQTTFRYLYEAEGEEPAAPAGDEGLEGPGDPGEDPPLSPSPEDAAPDAARGDIPVELAREILETAREPSRSALVARAEAILEDRAAREQEKLAEALEALGLDWSAPEEEAASGAPELSASFALEAEDGVVRAGEEVDLVGEVENVGDAPAHQVHARVGEAGYAAFRDVELAFGRLEPGDTETWTTTVAIPDHARDRIDVLSFDLRSAEDAPARAERLKVRVEAADRPAFTYSHHLIDEGVGDGLVREGGRYRLRVAILNEGEGAARDAAAVLRNVSGDDVSVRQGRAEIGELGPGEEETVEFVFEVADSVPGGDVAVEMNVNDRALREGVSDTLVYPIQPPSAEPGAESGWVRVREDDTSIRQGAGDQAPLIASADAGAAFPATGAAGEWIRIDLGEDRPGFIRSQAVARARPSPEPGPFDLHWHVQPPTLDLVLEELETRGETYALEGIARDETNVEDVYVFVSNRDADIENRKVFYRTNRGSATPRELAFQAELPLWPGTNRIRVVARENDDVLSEHTAYIYRHTSSATASATARTIERGARDP